MAYFPHHLQRDIKSTKHDQVESLSLSALLSAFKTFLKKIESLSRENKLLTSKANLVQSLTERNARLEDEIWSMRKVRQSVCYNQTFMAEVCLLLCMYALNSMYVHV